MLPAMKAIIPAATMALLANVTAQDTSCFPRAKRIKVMQTKQHPVQIAEFLALDEDDENNWASINRNVAVTQSTTYGKESNAINAIDGDLSTFSHTSNSTVNEWWQIVFDTGRNIGAVLLYTTFKCHPEDDDEKCHGRMSDAKVWLFGENGKWLTGRQLDSYECSADGRIVVIFEPEEKYCKTTEELATEFAESPGEKLEAGACQDDVGFVTPEKYTCADVAAMEANAQALLCERVANEDYKDENGKSYLFRHFCSITCGDCVPDARSEPSYSLSASMATAEAGVNSKGLHLGVGLSVGFVIVIFFTWLYSNAGKMKGVRSRHVSVFRGDPTLSENCCEYSDDDGVGLKKPSLVIQVPNMEGLFPHVAYDENVVPKTSIV